MAKIDDCRDAGIQCFETSCISADVHILGGVANRVPVNSFLKVLTVSPDIVLVSHGRMPQVSVSIDKSRQKDTAFCVNDFVCIRRKSCANR